MDPTRGPLEHGSPTAAVAPRLDAARRRLLAPGALLVLAATLFAASSVQAQTPTTLVSNTGQPTQHSNVASLLGDFAQAFTTGAHPDGYTLTAVELRLQVPASVSEPTYSVKICEQGSGNQPSSACPGTLTKPATLSTGTNTFRAGGGGIDLSASTTYFVFFDYISGGAGTMYAQPTSSNSEDPGGAAGWTIENHRRERITSAWTSNTVLQIAIKGYESTPAEESARGSYVYKPLPRCTEEQRQMRQRGREDPPACSGGFYHHWEIYPSSDPCDQPWEVPGSYRHDRGCLSRY